MSPTSSSCWESFITGPIISFNTLPRLTEHPGSRTFNTSSNSLQSLISLRCSTTGNLGDSVSSIEEDGVEDEVSQEEGNEDKLDLDVSEDDSSSSDVDIGFSFVFGVSGSTSFFVFADDLDDSFSLRTRNNTNFT